MSVSVTSEDFDSISVSEPSAKEQLIYDLINENKEVKDFTIRCPKCYNIPKFKADFDKNYYYTICDNLHKIESHSFNEFIENSIKNFDNLLCHECQKSQEDPSKMVNCTKCYQFFCLDCESKHSKETSHINFISLDKMNNYCIKHNELYKYFNNEKKKHFCQKCINEKLEKDPKCLDKVIELSKYIKYKDTINRYYKKAKENINMYNNISRAINEWLQNLTKKMNTFLSAIKNYCELQYKIVSSLNYENRYEKYENNFNAYYNYLTINNEETDKLIKNINNDINSIYHKNNDIFDSSKFYITLFDNLNKKDLNIESKKNISLHKEKKNKLPPQIKIENMNEKKIVEKHNVKVLIPFDEEKYIIVGYDNGDIRIYDEPKEGKIENNECNDNEKINEKLTLEVFKNEINNICEIDKDIIIASDINNIIKIIQIKDNLTKYSIIQELCLKENSGYVNVITLLPIFSYYKNRHIFCIGDDNHISIYKSNKMPLNLKNPALGYHDKVKEFSIVQPSFAYDNDKNTDKNDGHRREPYSFNLDVDLDLKIKTNSIVEINEKYMAVAFSKSECVKIYNMQNEFKEEINLPNIKSYDGNSTLCVSKDRDKLFIGCIQGFCMVYMDDIKKVIKYQFNQSNLCLDCFNDEYLVTVSLKNNEYYIKQYKPENENKKISKFSESKTGTKKEINNLKVIKDKIYYLDNTNCIHYYELNNKN